MLTKKSKNAELLYPIQSLIGINGTGDNTVYIGVSVLTKKSKNAELLYPIQSLIGINGTGDSTVYIGVSVLTKKSKKRRYGKYALY